MAGFRKALDKEAKRISKKRGVLLGPDNNIEFLKHFMNIILKN